MAGLTSTPQNSTRTDLVRALDRARHGWNQLPILARIAAIYVVARLITFLLLTLAADASTMTSRFGENATAATWVLAWDANWYWIVADVGYPDHLPLNEQGQPQENAWAFMPLFAWVAKLVSLPFGQWAAGALVVSLLSGMAACVALYALLRTKLTENQSLWAVVFFANGPLAALFHTGYAEPMYMALLLAALLALVKRRFGWLYLLIPLMGYTRPGVLAFALMLGLYGIYRWFHRKTDPLPQAQIVHIIALGALASIVGLSWQIIAGLAMGDMTAYLQTELSWRRNWLPESSPVFIPFDGWILGLNFWFGQWHLPAWLGWIAFLAVLVVTVIWLWKSRAVRALGPEIRLYVASYLLYLLAVFFPQSSTLRLLIPLAPLWGAPAQIRPLWGRLLVLAGCLIYQTIWIFEMFAYGNTITRVP